VREVRELRARDTARWLGAGSAVGVGAFGWLLAHVVTFWLATHSHHDSPSLSSWHVHGFAAAGTVVAGSLAAVWVIALLAASWWTGGSASSSPRGRRPSVHRAVGLSTGSFLAADAIEHAVFGLAPTPPTLMVLGVLLHALLGVGSSLLWLSFTDVVRSVLTAMWPSTSSGACPPVMPDQRSRRPRRLLWAAVVAGRAPPAVC
jgi:hypothetical protein